ncbi:MAG: LytR C-terminal domain-containing protein [Actinomycetes bacterium]
MSMLTPRGVGGHAPVRRGRRHRLGKVLLALLVIGALAAAWYAYLRDPGTETKTAAAPSASCPAPSPTPTVVPATLVKVNVFNATERRGLAATVAAELRKRGFRVGKVGNDPAKRTVTGVAEIRSSPTGAGPARTVGAQVDGFVALPDQRKDPSVDFVIGASFKALRTPAAAHAALAPTPAPRPSGC